jgi:lysophospholipase L1-like esterase
MQTEPLEAQPPRSVQAPPRSLVREALSWVCATAVGLLVLEAGARLLSPPPPPTAVPLRSNCLQRSASLGMEFRPNCTAAWTATFHTNSLGLRDPEIEDDGATRILAIGDSCTWGWGVPQGDAYPQVLQRLLDDRYGSGRYRVINAGTPGYTSYQGLVYLRERGLRLHPRIVIFGYAFNDAAPGGDIERALAVQRRLMPLVLLDDQLLWHSALWRGMRWLASRTSNDQELRVPPDRFRVNLEEIVRLTREHGAKPVMLEFAGTELRNPYARVMAELGGELGLPTVVYNGPRLDIVHPTAEGYVGLAEDILTLLQTYRYLPRPDR